MSSFQVTSWNKKHKGGKEESDAVPLTQEQRASSQGPAHLDVMNIHVLAGNVLHRNLLCNLEMNDFISLGLIRRQQIQQSVCHGTFISKQALPLLTP